MFASIAPRYDLANRLLSLGCDQYWRRVTARLLSPAPGQRALDLACGTGDLALALAAGGGEVVGVDFTQAMLVRAGARRQHHESLLLAAGDALRLPFRDGIFDRLTVAFGVRNFSDLPAALAEMRRVLVSSGQLGVLEFSQPHGPLSPLMRFYLNRLMPHLGQLLAGHRGPYDYLAATMRSWPEPDAFAALLRKTGFRDVTWRRLTGGVAALHLGRR